jgi:hypothetical protein
MGHTVTVVASADLIRYALGSAVLIGCFVLVWKLWALKPVEAAAARPDEPVPGAPLDTEEPIGMDSSVEDLVSGYSEQSTEQPSNTTSLYESSTSDSFDHPSDQPLVLPSDPSSDPLFDASSDPSFAASSSSALEDLFESVSSEVQGLPTDWHVSANDSEAIAESLDNTPSGAASPLTGDSAEQLLGARHDVESSWDSVELEWGSDSIEEESSAPAEETADASVDTAESLYSGSDDTTINDEYSSLPDDSEDSTERPVEAFAEGLKEPDAWAAATTSPSETTAIAAPATTSETTPLAAAKTTRAQKRAARRAERVAKLEARRDEAKQRQEEGRAKRAAKRAKRSDDPGSDAALAVSTSAVLDTDESGAAPATETVVLRPDTVVLDLATDVTPEIEEIDPFRAAALALLQHTDGAVVTPATTPVDASPVVTAPVVTSPVKEGLSEEPDAEEQPTSSRRKWRGKQARSVSQVPEENHNIDAPTPFSIVPFSDTAWDDAVGEEEIIVPVAPEPPRLDEWAAAALAETWAQPLPVTPESTDPHSIDHHAYGLPEPLPQRRPAAFSA